MTIVVVRVLKRISRKYDGEKTRGILWNCLMQLLGLAGGKFKVHKAGWLVGDSGKNVGDVGLSPKGWQLRKAFYAAVWRQDGFFEKSVFSPRDFNLLDEVHSHCAG